MAILQKTREKAGMAVSIIIALALLSFIVDPSTLETAFQAMSKKNDVGEINGTSVSYTDFSQDIDRFTTINEMVTGSSVQSEKQQQQVRNIAWQSLVDKYLFIKNANAAGLKVGEEEMKELLVGDMISPLVAQNPAFLDENGQFSKEAVQNLINSIPGDNTGRIKTYWDYVQTSVNTQQYYAKYNSLFAASNVQNPLMLKKAIAENNNTTNVDFVMIPLPFMMDSTVTVSEAEIQKFYNDHKKLFKQNASRDMEYVVFEVKPSDSDIQATADNFASLYEEFASASNMKSFLARNSEKSYSEYWYKENELETVNAEISAFVKENGVGSVSPIIKSNNNVFYAVKVLATEQIPERVNVKIIPVTANTGATAEEILAEINGGVSFKDAAAKYYPSQNPEAEPGDFGWLSQTQMLPGLESTITAPINVPYVSKVQGTDVVVMVAERENINPCKQVAILQKTTLASNETFNEYYAKANRFASLCSGKYENYQAAVDTMGVYSHPMNNVAESNSVYGAIDQAKEVTRWIYDNKPGKVSEIITVNNNYFFVATVKAIHKEGIANLKEVSETIRQQLYSEKLSEKAASDVAEKISGMTDLEAVAEALGSTVSSGVDVRFATMAGQGMDPKFIGAASIAPEGQICGPVAGTIGTYVFKVNSRETGAFYTEDDARTSAAQMMNYSVQMVVPVMMQAADVKDNRARFF
ncbi:MAG: SurA N-terminal domain-containing protein [Bacteroidaceae bacterium]|nr:SurA N-terminal domain-containing protein [Bacteroidaceae bacterium]